MKRIMLLTLVLVLAIFVMPTHADPIPKEVEVINAPDNAVPVQGDVQVTNSADVNVTNTAGNSVPVTVTNPATCNATIKAIARQDNLLLNPTPSEDVDLITLSGPGTFVSARFVVSDCSLPKIISSLCLGDR